MKEIQEMEMTTMEAPKKRFADEMYEAIAKINLHSGQPYDEAAARLEAEEMFNQL